MRFGSTVFLSAFVVACAVPSFASPHARRGPTSQHFSSAKKSASAHKPLAQRSIDSDRTTQIQAALIDKGYLSGSPTGTWTPETQEALRKLQAENGWQTKMVPDSRAIIKLGLGPGSPAAEGTNLAEAPSTAAPNTFEAEPANLSQR